jgi:diguanylate cyclase
MTTPLRALIIEDSADDAALILRELSRHGFQPLAVRVETREALHAALDGQEWDVIICDYRLPGFNGLEALAIVRRRNLDVPFVIVSGNIGEEIAVSAMKNGAQDYIMKDRLARLAPAIERELREAQVRRERRHAEDRARHLARYDAVTELPNLTQLQERLAAACADAAGGGTPLALMMLNISRFREFNEALGHNNGDVLLRAVAARLRRLAGPADIAARIGGDEFALALIPGTPARARALTATAVEMMIPPFDVDGFHVGIDVRAGVALVPAHGTDPRQLLQRADVALACARRQNKPWFLYDPTLDPSSPERLLLAGELRTAVGDDELVAWFQPKVALRGGAVQGIEVLARWPHPQRGLMAPDEFIPLAERTGLIRDLTHGMLQAAARHARAWHGGGRPLRAAVNLSARNVADRTMVQRVETLLADGDVSPDMLEFEITESAVMEDPDHSIATLAAFRAMGIRLAIDDFGTGYSSLNYLRRLPVDTVKIDKSFVHDLLLDDGAATIIRATIDLAHGLGLVVVAEGVENRDVLERLQDWNCDEAQGFHIARPMTTAGLDGWLEDRMPPA